MPLINLTRVGNNLIVFAILFGIGFMIYSKLDREKVRSTMDGIKNMFGRKEEK